MPLKLPRNVAQLDIPNVELPILQPPLPTYFRLDYWYDFITEDYMTEYSIGVGWNALQANWNNFTDYFSNPPRTNRRINNMGDNRVTTIGRNTIANGLQILELTYAACDYSELESFAKFACNDVNVMSSGDTSYKVTIRAKQLDNTFTNYNAWFERPVEGVHYENYYDSQLENVRLVFNLI